MKPELAVAHVKSVQAVEVERYKRYLSRITPATNEDLFRRWLFAFSSVHTTWLSNVRLYRKLERLEWLGDKVELKRLIVESGAGFYNRRTDYIHAFAEWFWAHPDWYWHSSFETWTGFRDRIMDSALGIGRAKSSFVVELMYPETAEVTCTDTHMLQAYAWTPQQISAGKVSAKEETAIEAHWVALCKAAKVPPTIARWIAWDKKQGRSDPRYWSFVFEKDDYHAMLGGQVSGNTTTADQK